MSDLHFFRCEKHASIAPHNTNAPNGEECGACIMREVAWLVHHRLDQLDVLAALLRDHARLRYRVAQLEGQLRFLVPDFPES